ncbi:MAG: hypothetical protein L0I62_01070, partial [Gammaproteobacteria bacterium]|nr:hypothetical protein [Gammaproteobacteria bacterium]
MSPKPFCLPLLLAATVALAACAGTAPETRPTTPRPENVPACPPAPATAQAPAAQSAPAPLPEPVPEVKDH